jgi:TusA-related sulfurtransferase
MAPAVATLDVRDMMCAQALAVVAHAVERAAIGTSVDVCYNATDVKHDLSVWAREQGHGVHEAGNDLLRIQRVG